MTAFSVVTDFRVQVNDIIEPFKYRDALVLIWFNDGIKEIYAKRPEAYDAIVYDDDSIDELTDISSSGDNFPFGDYFKRAMVLHLLHRAAEHIGDYNKALQYETMFRMEVTGR